MAPLSSVQRTVNQILKFDSVPCETTLSWNKADCWLNFRRDPSCTKWIAFNAKGRAIWFSTGSGIAPLKMMNSYERTLFETVYADVMKLPGNNICNGETFAMLQHFACDHNHILNDGTWVHRHCCLVQGTRWACIYEIRAFAKLGRNCVAWASTN